MTGFSIAEIHSDFYAVFHNGKRVGIVFPARPATAFPPAPAEPWSLAPDPEAFPDLACAGLPRPMQPWFTPFESLAEIAEYLGISADEREAA